MQHLKGCSSNLRARNYTFSYLIYLVHQVGLNFQRILLKVLQLCLVKRFQLLDVFLPDLLVQFSQQAGVAAGAGQGHCMGGAPVTSLGLPRPLEILIAQVVHGAVCGGGGLVVALQMIYLSCDHSPNIYLHILLLIFK